jgi:hypothetical protein
LELRNRSTWQTIYSDALTNSGIALVAGIVILNTYIVGAFLCECMSGNPVVISFAIHCDAVCDAIGAIYIQVFTFKSVNVAFVAHTQ